MEPVMDQNDTCVGIRIRYCMECIKMDFKVDGIEILAGTWEDNCNAIYDMN